MTMSAWRRKGLFALTVTGNGENILTGNAYLQ